MQQSDVQFISHDTVGEAFVVTAFSNTTTGSFSTDMFDDTVVGPNVRTDLEYTPPTSNLNTIIMEHVSGATGEFASRAFSPWVPASATNGQPYAFREGGALVITKTESATTGDSPMAIVIPAGESSTYRFRGLGFTLIINPPGL
jgi:hypothetical protein